MSDLDRKQYYDTLQAGANFGTAGAGLGFAVGGPVGAAIGGGIGAVGGMLYEGLSGPSEYEQQRAKEIEDLKRRQELGILGLTDEERAVLEAKLIDPVRAQQRGAALQQQAAMASMQGGPATAARMAVGEQQRIAEQLQPSLIEIERADLAKAQAEEDLLIALTRESQQDVEKAKQQMYGSMLNAASAGMTLRAAGQKEAMQAGQAKAAEEFNKAFQSYATSPNADPAMTMLLMQAYGMPIGVPTSYTSQSIGTPQNQAVNPATTPKQ
jgi:hypothetical protein